MDGLTTLGSLSDYDTGQNSTTTILAKFPCEKEPGNCTSSNERDEELAKVEMATLAVMFIMTVVGNGAILAALIARRRLSTRVKVPRMNFFMLHLCVADMCTAWLNILPQLAWKVTFRFKGGDILCKSIKFGQTLGPYLSSYVLTATALDRYQAICYPLTYCSWSSKRARLMIFGAWGLTITFCSPQVAIFSYHEIAPGVYDCWAVFHQKYGERIYVTWYSVSVFVVPLVTLIYTYTCICRTIWSNAGSITASAPHKVVSRAKINTIKQTVAVILLYIVCSLPFICAQLWATWDPNAASSPFLTGTTFTILTLLSSLNSCVNPWIYLMSNNDLLDALGQMLSCWKQADRVDSVGSGGSTSKQNQNCNLLGQHTHYAKWVVSVPPNISDVTGRSRVTPQARVLELFDEEPTLSTRKAARRLNASFSSIHCCLRDDGRSEKSTLRLFRAPHRDVWTSLDAKCETTDSKLSPEL